MPAIPRAAYRSSTKSTDGTSAMIHSSKPGRLEQAGVAEHRQARSQLALGAHEGQHHVQVRVALVPPRATARSSSASRSGSRVYRSAPR